MDDYFWLLMDALIENDLMDSPNQIYAVDETGIQYLDHRAPKVVTDRGQYDITVIECVSASGHALPPSVILDAKSLNKERTKGEVPSCTYGLNSNMFQGWLTDHFIKFSVGMFLYY